MPISTISTYAAFQSTLNDVGKTETTLTNEQQQLSSGNAAASFSDMATQVQQYLSLNASLSKTTQYLNNNKVIEARVNTTSSILDQVISAGNSLQSLISERISGTGDTSSFGVQLQGSWQSLVSQLNTEVDGQYLFSGTKTDTPAVNASTFPTLQQPGVPDDGYYQGSSQDLTVQPEDNVQITYNVRANAPGFQKIFAGLAMAQQGDQQNDTATLQQAETLVQQGVQEVTATQATVNANKVAFTNIDSNLQTLQTYWTGLQQSIGNTDIVSVSTQVAVNQGILQAAFQTFAKIVSLQLSKYLPSA